VFAGVRSYSELVKTVIEIGSSSVQLTCAFSSALAKLAGDHALAHACAEVGEHVGKTLEKVVAGIEIVHGAAQLFDPNASREQRIDGAAEIGMGVGVLATGSSIGALPVAGPYYLAKAAAHLFREAALGWETGFLRELFHWMEEQGAYMAHALDHIAIAGMLQKDEKDPAQRAALAQREQLEVGKLSGLIGAFLDRCKSGAAGQGGVDRADTTAPMAHFPGNYQLVAEVFAPLLSLQGVRGEAQVIAGAGKILEAITWCFQHGESLAIGAVKHMSLAELKEAEAEEAERAKKKKNKEE
jgi:hypothetical protein